MSWIAVGVIDRRWRSWCHTVPVNDLRLHEFHEACWCRPTVDNEEVLHHALDDRERYPKRRNYH